MMATTSSGYDTDLQMFVEPPHDVDLKHLSFTRWLVLHGRFEHGVAGPSTGALTDVASPPQAGERGA